MYDAPDETFDVVISCEVMEHNPFWPETMANMIRLLRPGGLMVMSCASVGRKEHGTVRSLSWDSPFQSERGSTYYQNLTKRRVCRKLNISGLSSSGFANNWTAFDLYFLGIKGPASVNASQRIAELRAIYRSRFFGSLCRQFRRLVCEPSLISKRMLRGRWW